MKAMKISNLQKEIQSLKIANEVRITFLQCIQAQKLFYERILSSSSECGTYTSASQASKYQKIGTCPASQKILAYMGKNNFH